MGNRLMLELNLNIKILYVEASTLPLLDNKITNKIFDAKDMTTLRQLS